MSKLNPDFLSMMITDSTICPSSANNLSVASLELLPLKFEVEDTGYRKNIFCHNFFLVVSLSPSVPNISENRLGEFLIVVLRRDSHGARSAAANTIQ